MASEARIRFGNRVRSIRQEKEITQESLAELLGKSVEHLSFIERGEQFVNNFLSSVLYSVNSILESSDLQKPQRAPFRCGSLKKCHTHNSSMIAIVTKLIASPVSPKLVEFEEPIENYQPFPK